MREVNLASARIVTVRELTRATAEVLRSVNESGEPAVVTRHGRFVAVISPLEGARLEVYAMGRLAERLPDAAEVEQDDGQMYDASTLRAGQQGN